MKKPKEYSLDHELCHQVKLCSCRIEIKQALLSSCLKFVMSMASREKLILWVKFFCFH